MAAIREKCGTCGAEYEVAAEVVTDGDLQVWRVRHRTVCPGVGTEA